MVCHPGGSAEAEAIIIVDVVVKSGLGLPDNLEPTPAPVNGSPVSRVSTPSAAPNDGKAALPPTAKSVASPPEYLFFKVVNL